MAIGRETPVTFTTTTTAFTNTAGTYLILACHHNESDGTFTGLTYDGSPFTLLKSQEVDGANSFAQLWGLANPSTGAHDIVASGTAPYDRAYASSYTEAALSSDTAAGASATAATSVTTTINIGTADSWVVAAVRNSAGSGQTNNGGVAEELLIAAQEDLFWDSNGTVATGDQTVSYVRAADNRNWGLATISLSPPGAAVATTSTSGRDFMLNGAS